MFFTPRSRMFACTAAPDRKSTRLNSSHRCNSYAVFCLKKKTEKALEPLDNVEQGRAVHGIFDFTAGLLGLRLVSIDTQTIPVFMSLNLEILSRAADQAR